MISLANAPQSTAISNTLSSTFSKLSASTERLASGLRIQNAADDASGLAIRELMRGNIAAVSQGIRNAMDAISLLQTVDGALAIIDEKLIRMKELAEQAATGTYNQVQRLMIQSEYTMMGSEIDRIAKATEFNSIKLLNESTTTKVETKVFNRISASEQWQEYHFSDIKLLDRKSNDYAPSVIEGLSNLQGLPDDFEGSFTITMLNDDVSYIGDSGKILTYQNFTSQEKVNYIISNQLVPSDTPEYYELTFHSQDATGQGYGNNKWYISNAGYQYIVRHDESEDADNRWWFHEDGGTIISVIENKTYDSGLARINFEPLVYDPETNTTYSYSNAFTDDPFGLDGKSGQISMVADFEDPTYTYEITGDFTGSGAITGVYDFPSNTFTFLFDLGDGVTVEQTLVTNGYPDRHSVSYFSRTFNIDLVHVDGDLSYEYDKDSHELQGIWNTLTVDTTEADPTYTIVVEDSDGNEVGSFRATQSHGTWVSSSSNFQVQSNGNFTITNLALDENMTYTLRADIDQDGYDITRMDRVTLGPGAIIFGDKEEWEKEMKEQEEEYVPPLIIHFGPGNSSLEDYYGINRHEVSLSALGLLQSAVSTQEASQRSLKMLDSAIEEKDKIRTYFGTMQNRLENTIASLTNELASTKAAESRISDLDISSAMTEFVQNQILAQAGIAMLAQANSTSQYIMQLIQ